MAQGRYADGTWGAGVRRTFAVSVDEAWRAWGAPGGLARWLAAPRGEVVEGEEFELDDGTRARAVRVRAPTQLRLRLSRPEWPTPRTVQLRVIAAKGGATVALHAEGLPDAATRESYLERWTRALQTGG